jgi:hypothetical protein
MRNAVVAAVVIVTGVVALWSGLTVWRLLEPVELPAVASNWGDRAVARGAEMPDQVGLRRAVLKHEAVRPAPKDLGHVRRMCFDLPEAYVYGIPPGNWVPDAADLKWLADRGFPVASGYGSCQQGEFPTLFVTPSRPARWWNQPKEVEVDDLCFYFSHAKSVPVIQYHRLVLTHEGSSWKVIRDEPLPVPDLYGLRTPRL